MSHESVVKREAGENPARTRRCQWGQPVQSATEEILEGALGE